MKKKGRVRRLFWEILVILLGSLIFALVFDGLFVPNTIVMGGLTGVGQIINRLVPSLPVGALSALMNIPLFIIAIHLQGWHILYASLFAMLVSSAFVDLLPMFIQFAPMEDKLVAALFGGVGTGLGMGLLLFVGATTGGTELGARILKHRFRHVPVGRLCLYIDVAVVLAYALIFGEIKDVFYGIIAMYISAEAMDGLIYGKKNSKLALIITEREEAVARLLLAGDLGVTSVQARGAYSGESRGMLFCAFKPSRIALIKKAVLEADPAAFVVVADAAEVYGEGFSECDPNSL